MSLFFFEKKTATFTTDDLKNLKTAEESKFEWGEGGFLKRTYTDYDKTQGNIHQISDTTELYSEDHCNAVVDRTKKSKEKWASLLDEMNKKMEESKKEKKDRLKASKTAFKVMERLKEKKKTLEEQRNGEKAGSEDLEDILAMDLMEVLNKEVDAENVESMVEGEYISIIVQVHQFMIDFQIK